MNKNYLVCMLWLFTLHVAGAPQISTRATEFECGDGSDCQARLREVLRCVSFPAGVFGFYAWLCLLVAPIWSMANLYRQAAKADGNLKGMTPWDIATTSASVVLTTLSATVSMYQNITSISQCEHAQEFSLVRDLVQTLLASDVIALAAGVTVAFYKVEGHFMWVAGTLYAIAFAIAGLGGWLSYLKMLFEGGTLAWDVHPLPHSPMAVCFIGWILVVWLVCIVYYKLRKRLERVLRGLGLGCVLGSFWLVLSCAFGAAGYVLLGTLAGDVWGAYWAKEPVGTLLAVVVPIVLLGIAILCWLDTNPLDATLWRPNNIL